jgi:hypothetical protein
MIIEFYCLTDDEAGNKDISLGNNLLIPFMVEAINYRAKISPGHLIEDQHNETSIEFPSQFSHGNSHRHQV